MKGSRWLSLEQVASPQAAATAPETSAVFWSPSWDSMAAAVGQGAACELDPGPAPRPCCGRGCHHPRLCPGPPAPVAGGLPQCCAPRPRSEARTGGRGARGRQEQSESLQEGPSTGATRRQSSMR